MSSNRLLVANSSLVPSATLNVCSTTNPTATDCSEPTSAISTSESKISRLDHLRQRYKAEGLSSDATKLISRSWRQGTEKQYESAWKCWVSWCSGRKIDPFASSVLDIANFSGSRTVRRKVLLYITFVQVSIINDSAFSRRSSCWAAPSHCSPTKRDF